MTPLHKSHKSHKSISLRQLLYGAASVVSVVLIVVAIVVILRKGSITSEQASEAPPAPSPSADITNFTAADTKLLSTEGRKLVADDEFDGTEGAAPNSDAWDYDLGGGGWGNNEKQTYTKDPANVRLSGDGNLVIDLLRDGDSYTSGRLVTRGKAAFEYGLLEARIKLPEGQGIHPAFWLLGSNIEMVDYPACGEIDVVEMVNSGNNSYTAIHGPQEKDMKTEWQVSHRNGSPYTDIDLAQDYHVYQVYHAPGYILIGIDGHPVAKYTPSIIPTGAKWVFDEPTYLTLNIAVGGQWPGPVGPDTKFPATMLVDFVRAWQ
jgi:beta-glucanase (GH16 family)